LFSPKEITAEDLSGVEDNNKGTDETRTPLSKLSITGNLLQTSA